MAFILSAVRTAMFGWQGYRTYTQSAFLAAKADFTHEEVDLSGQVALITGANSGIGKAAALTLLTSGAEVHLICRSAERGEAAMEELVKDSGSDAVRLHVLDLSSIRDVQRFARDFVATGGRCDILINNAACGSPSSERTLTAEGLEQHFAVNLLAPFVLTKELLPAMTDARREAAAAGPARVIMVSSGGMLTAPLEEEDPQLASFAGNGIEMYARNKRALVAAAEVMAEEWEPAVRVQCMHPGWVDTPILRKNLPDFYARMKDNLRTPAAGADTIAWLAMSEEALAYDAALFFLDRRPQEKHLSLARTSYSPERARKLWLYLDETAKSVDASAAEGEAASSGGSEELVAE